MRERRREEGESNARVRKLTVDVDKVAQLGVPLRYLEHDLPPAVPRPPAHLRHGPRDEDIPGARPCELGEEVVVCFSFLAGDGARGSGCKGRVEEQEEEESEGKREEGPTGHRGAEMSRGRVPLWRVDLRGAHILRGRAFIRVRSLTRAACVAFRSRVHDERRTNLETRASMRGTLQ